VALAVLAGRPQALRARVRLPSRGDAAAVVDGRRLALSAGAAWVIAADGRVVEVDRSSTEVVRVLSLAARAVAADGRRAWVLDADGTVLPVDERGGITGTPIDIGSAASELAVGGGAVWVRNPNAGAVIRIDVADPARRRSTPVAAGAGDIVYGHGALWVADRARGRLVRLDPATGETTGAVAVGGTPRNIAVAPDGLWVTVTPRSGAAAMACGPTVSGPGGADVVVAVELPLRRTRRSPTAAMAAAVDTVFARNGHRAGRLRVGYRLCDDSTAQTGTWDPEKCAANARAYAADRRVVAEIGPYNSGCARAQLPILAQATGGAPAMISPTATSPELTSNLRPGRSQVFSRVIARDDQEAAAMVAELRRRGHRRVVVLDDADGSPTGGYVMRAYFVAAARTAGLRIPAVMSWGPGIRAAALARRVARLHPDAVYVSGLLDNGAGEMIRALRRAQPARIRLSGPSLLLPVGTLFDRAGAAAR
jgi:hypothetical protein